MRKIEKNDTKCQKKNTLNLNKLLNVQRSNVNHVCITWNAFASILFFPPFFLLFSIWFAVCVSCIWPIWVCEYVHAVQIEFISDAIYFMWMPSKKKDTMKKSVSSLGSYCETMTYHTCETIRNQIYPRTSASELWYGIHWSWTKQPQARTSDRDIRVEQSLKNYYANIIKCQPKQKKKNNLDEEK